MHLGNTVYRIHGTNAPETIGQAVSSGCFRLVNDDVADLYDRVLVGIHVIVRQRQAFAVWALLTLDLPIAVLSRRLVGGSGLEFRGRAPCQTEA
jgi:hypothetical protein